MPYDLHHFVKRLVDDFFTTIDLQEVDEQVGHRTRAGPIAIYREREAYIA